MSGYCAMLHAVATCTFMPSNCQFCHRRLKKELEEKCPEVAEPLEKVDPHQKLCDITVKGPPGTKVETMKVVNLAHYSISISSCCLTL